MVLYCVHNACCRMHCAYQLFTVLPVGKYLHNCSGCDPTPCIVTCLVCCYRRYNITVVALSAQCSQLSAAVRGPRLKSFRNFTTTVITLQLSFALILTSDSTVTVVTSGKRVVFSAARFSGSTFTKKNCYDFFGIRDWR